MNRTFVILLLLLSVLFTACQSDEPAIDEGGKTDGKDLGYIAVSIVQPKSVTGRGASNDGFQDGTPDENEAKDATFFVFDDSETPECKSIQTIGLTGSGSGSSTAKPYTEKIYNAVLVFDNITDENKYNGEIFCVLNAPDELKSLTTITKSALLKKVADYCTGKTSAGTFIMTNSAYNTTSGGSTSEIRGASFTSDNFKTSAKEALDSPVDIYVERVVAKVITNAPNFRNNGVTDPLDDNNTLEIRITGIGIANTAQTANLFKNLGNTNTIWPSWEGFAIHDEANKRCYWEDMPDNLQFGNEKYSTYSSNTTPTSGNVYTKLKDANYALTKYIHPNTSWDKTTSKAEHSTCVLVTAQLLNKTTVEGSETYTPADLVWMMGGYISNEGAKNILCQYLASANFAVKETTSEKTSYTQITARDLEWAQKQNISASSSQDINNLEDYQAVAQVKLEAKEGITRSVIKYDFVNKKEIKKNETTGTSYDIYDADVYLVSENIFFAEVFKNGLCYYFVNIDQSKIVTSISSAIQPYPGVVRNHIYDLTLNSITGIGTAVFDPEKVIDPVLPPHDGFNYLSARINVLPWKLVKQTVDFQGN